MKAPIPIDEILRSIEGFSSHHVLVVGDFFVDEYVEGEMVEISKEGPIPVVQFRSKTATPGAAGNLASSIRALGARVSIAGVVGDDPNGKLLLNALKDQGIDTSGAVIDETFDTLTYGKIRAWVESAPSREILRLDVFPRGPLSEKTETRVLEEIRRQASDVDAIIVLDQIGHLITKRILDELPEIAKKHDVYLQGSSRDHLRDLHDFDLVIPNDQETIGAVSDQVGENASITELGEALLKRGNHRAALLTLGPEGMAAFEADRNPGDDPTRLPTVAEDVVDVTGAGDAVSSTTILGMLSSWNLKTAAWCASHSAAIAIAQVGTHHVSRAELEEVIRSPS